MFRKLELFLPQARGQSSEGLPSHMRTEKDPVSKTICSLAFKILDAGQRNKSNSEDKKVK